MDLFHRFRSNGSDSSSAKPKVTDKRREQLRKAQRAHRERSKAYTDALEQEIINLRAEDSRTLQAYKTENALLRQLLALNKIAIPELFQSQLDAVNVRIHSDRHHPKRSFLQIESQPSPEQGASDTTSPTWLSPDPSSQGTSTSPNRGPSSSIVHGAEPQLDPQLVQIGINFILYLEHPCLDHAHLLSANYPGNNHAFVPTTALFAFADTPPEQLVATARSGQNSPVWTSPTTQLESLLNLCSQIVENNEIAPVMMWQSAMTALSTGELKLEQIPALQQQLGDYVDCRE
ncbi:hypothetical protein K461DRAFT_154180 [Myriangium duriaei CBS 260.36]|uniref:BZIP domain-containing protein n=1 Tax=Myriangium duriaei CBS 260.36 TaxID=1168546 RepID=A0A9P4MLC8_9PEZI|nr:hypothetical protein K461DRAFT_154180 [Myriangium duriaei CBS 260.36]